MKAYSAGALAAACVPRGTSHLMETDVTFSFTAHAQLGTPCPLHQRDSYMVYGRTRLHVLRHRKLRLGPNVADGPARCASLFVDVVP